jgi:hypothetical protein
VTEACNFAKFEFFQLGPMERFGLAFATTFLPRSRHVPFPQGQNANSSLTGIDSHMAPESENLPSTTMEFLVTVRQARHADWWRLGAPIHFQ